MPIAADRMAISADTLPRKMTSLLILVECF
jgi:hypothetical protein